MDLTLHLEYRAPDSLIPNPHSARIHSPTQISKIRRSIEGNGFLVPLVIDSNSTVIAGHGRLLAARQLGLMSVPVIQIHHLSETQQRAYMLADNRIAEDAEWDRNLLRVELSFLASVDVDFEVTLTGFETPEIDILIAEDPSNGVVEPPAEPLPEVGQTVSRPNDQWELGPHRIRCADVRDPAAVAQLMEGKQARLVLTDPPYNVPVAGHVSGLGRHQHPEFAMASGEMDADTFVAFLTLCLHNLARVSLEGSLHFVCIDWRHVLELLKAGKEVYSDLINICVWAKANGGMGSLYRSQHELFALFKKGRIPHVNNIELGRHGRNRTNVWQYAGMNSFSAERDEALSLHPTVKPVRMFADAILDVSHRGEIVIDGFLGSGTTLLAAEQVGRICYALEIEPRYVDVAIRRWQRLTGDTARLSSTNQTFVEVADERMDQEEAVATHDD